MKWQVSATLAVGALFLSGCNSTPGIKDYTSTVKSELRISHVYIPPNNAYHPYTLLQYKEGEGYQPICSTSLLTGITDAQLASKIQRADIAQTNINNNFKTDFEVTLGKDDIGNADIRYLKTKKVELTFANGKQVSIPSVHMSDAVQNIQASKCAADIRLISSEIKDAQFLLPNVVFSYDLDYKFYDESGTNLSAGMPEALKKVILSKVGLSRSGNNDMKLVGNNLYIGFRGLPLNATVKKIAGGEGRGLPQKIVVLNGEKPPIKTAGSVQEAYVADVTNVVQDIINRQ